VPSGEMDLEWGEEHEMTSTSEQPTTGEMETILRQAGRCLDCDAPECFEATPEGVDACAGLQYWDGKPVTKSTLVSWQERLSPQPAGQERSPK
jgi:hypothetical protein